jgi:hypothetical protein
MLKRSILLLSALFVTSALAQDNPHFFIRIHNAGIEKDRDGDAPTSTHPQQSHNLAYLITTPAGESIDSSYSPASATVAPGVTNSVYVSRTDGSTFVTAHLKVVDLSLNGRVVWEGELFEDFGKTQIYVRERQTPYITYSISTVTMPDDFQLDVAVWG